MVSTSRIRTYRSKVNPEMMRDSMNLFSWSLGFWGYMSEQDNRWKWTIVVATELAKMLNQPFEPDRTPSDLHMLTVNRAWWQMKGLMRFKRPTGLLRVRIGMDLSVASRSRCRWVHRPFLIVGLRSRCQDKHDQRQPNELLHVPSSICFPSPHLRQPSVVFQWYVSPLS